MNLEQGRLGYRFDIERTNELYLRGDEPELLMKTYQDSFPVFDVHADPLGVFDILDQKNQGSCQGHALSGVAQVCLFLATGRKLQISRAANYYLSQKVDNIRGDNGSTLSAGLHVATIHGMCYESDWPYPSSYNPTPPMGISYPFKLKVSRPFERTQELLDWIDLGLPVQIGITWNPSCNKEVVDRYSASIGGGGHSTFYWLRKPNGNVKMPNSWGSQWCSDGCNEWTEASIAAALASRWCQMIGYAPDRMEYPPQPPLPLPLPG